MSDLEKRTQRFIDFDRLMTLAEPRKFREKAVKLVDRKVYLFFAKKKIQKITARTCDWAAKSFADFRSNCRVG